MNRRQFLRSTSFTAAGLLVAAPAIVRAENLMKIWVPDTHKTFFRSVSRAAISHLHSNERNLPGSALTKYFLQYSRDGLISRRGDVIFTMDNKIALSENRKIVYEAKYSEHGFKGAVISETFVV